MQKNVEIVYFYGPKKGHGAPPKYFYKYLNCLISSKLVSYLSNSIKKKHLKRYIWSTLACSKSNKASKNGQYPVYINGHGAPF